jgi:hypothetical protein
MPILVEWEVATTGLAQSVVEWPLLAGSFASVKFSMHQ